ncbi:hypothetical protein AB0F07_12035 [Streptomyces fructofermentans]|uniref:hypothetical protein n=1 Tax=Streptomyces fructofermentans TaxID=152141 RepID=UPI0033DDAB0E
MKRRTLPVAAAFAASAALLLTACGGEDDTSKDSDKIAGAGQSEEGSASPSAAASDSVERPEVTLPKDIDNVFENWKTGDATKDAVLADVTRRVNATDAAISAGDPDSDGIKFYYKGEALIGAVEWVQGYAKDGRSITGTTRYFKPELKVVDKDTAAVAYCSDESKAYDKDRKTGKADKTAATKNSYVTYSARLQKNDQGVWQTTSLLSERGNAKCTP